jgi:hypothetical protein
MEIRIQFELDEVTYLKAWRQFQSTSLKRTFGWLFALSLGCYLFGAVSLRIWSINWISFAVALAAGFGLVLWWNESYMRRVAQTLRDTRGALGYRQITFRADNLSTQSDGRVAHMDWTAMAALWRTPDLFLLTTGPTSCSPIPLEAFGNSADADQIVAWAVAKGVRVVQSR